MATKEQMINYLQTYFLGIGFQDLYDFVIKKNNCILCGTCVSICPRIGMRKNNPILLENDPECSTCFRYCARTYFPKEIFEKEIFNSPTHKNILLGSYQKVVAAKSRDKIVINLSQNGGIVSTLLIQALNSRLIDGVLLTGRDEKWLPKPVIARTPEEILDNMGSKYTIAPTLFTYSDATYDYKLKKLAFVGMPCQIQAARKLQLWPPLSDKFGKFRLIIGLYCSSNYSYDLMKKFVRAKLGIPLSIVSKFDISHGKFYVYTKGGLVREVLIKDIKKYNWPSCQYCKDYTAEFADISIGNVGAPGKNWNSVILRSGVGVKLFYDAVASGKIIHTDNIDLSRIEKESLKKKSRITKIDKKVISAMQFLNLSDIEIRTYASIMSLGHADISILSRLMKEPEIKVQKVLNILMKREWVQLNDGVYSSVNPYKVVKNEIYKFKKNLEENIKKIKSDALIDLEALFIQNNFMKIQYKELLDLYL